eukprot:2663088-Rhodomonas_salina.6
MARPVRCSHARSKDVCQRLKMDSSARKTNQKRPQDCLVWANMGGDDAIRTCCHVIQVRWKTCREVQVDFRAAARLREGLLHGFQPQIEQKDTARRI